MTNPSIPEHREPPPIVGELYRFAADKSLHVLAMDRESADDLADFIRRLQNANPLEWRDRALKAEAALAGKLEGPPELNPFAPDAEPGPSCGCRVCNPRAWWMVVCDKCGNKRCPHAEDHRFECSGSNAPNQVGKLAGTTAGT